MIGDALFEPLIQLHSDLLVPNALVNVGLEGKTTRVIANAEMCLMLLEKGDLVGKLQKCEVLQPGETEDMPAIEVATISPNATDGECLEKLKHSLQLGSIHLNLDKKSELLALVAKFSSLFALNGDELGQKSLVTHKINTGDHRPIKQQPCRLPFALCQHVQQLTGKMFERGVITPCSPWASSVVFVAKKDGSTRFCIDYR